MNEKVYLSTRGNQKPLDFYEAILQGIGSDGGLLIPAFDLDKMDLQSLKSLNYVDMATEIISSFTPNDAKEDIRELCKKAYGSGLFPDDVVPVKKAGDVYVAELFQGPTAAFKDMALSILPHFMTFSLNKKGEDRTVMILAATSGDTGKAALEGFKDIQGTTIKVFYPLEGVSLIQKQQMVTQIGENVDVIGIRGNFDDAQTAVKKALNSQELKDICDQNHVFLSSANSINIGRLIPQIVYYFYSYMTLVNQKQIIFGEEVNFTIPSGNFGNCLAGYIAKSMGLPIKKFIIASNHNNILTDFFNTGKYDTNREFYKTNAPAMDILISSNLERLVYFLCKDATKVKCYMEKLNETGIYEVDNDIFKQVQEQFSSGWLNEDEIMGTIGECYRDNGYLLDTHTAIGYGVYNKYKEKTQDQTKTILLSTASPYKFPESVYQAICGEKLDEYTAIEALNKKTTVGIPKPLQGIKEREILHNKAIDKNIIIEFIGEQIKGLSK